jgi:hypothetical protein
MPHGETKPPYGGRDDARSGGMSAYLNERENGSTVAPAVSSNLRACARRADGGRRLGTVAVQAGLTRFPRAIETPFSSSSSRRRGRAAAGARTPMDEQEA